MAFVVQLVTKGLSKGIGLAGEKYYDHKDRKAALAAQDQKSQNPHDDKSHHLEEQTDFEASDERIWALDEAAGDPPAYEEVANAHDRPIPDRTVSELVHDTTHLQYGQSPERPRQQARLPYPIIIPQRRPGSKGRGFARAYPTDLGAFNIDQDQFMRFLENFQQASEASPWLNTLFISAGVVGLIPGHITIAVSLSVQIAAGTAIEIQSRYRANAFLDQMNKELFMPLGLYCMVLLCKDEPGSSAEKPIFGYETVNLENAKHITKWGLPVENEDEKPDASSKSKQVLRPIRLVSGKVKESEMPLEIAPLVYPGLEDMIERPAIKRDESFKERLMRNKEFVADYFDRRAQADYTGNNPDAALTKASSVAPEFRTRFADPNHPCNNGHLVSLITGGKLVAQPLGARTRRGRHLRLREVGEDGKLKPKSKQERPIHGPVSLVARSVRKVMQKNILYLTIVNMPNEEELAEARRVLEADGGNLKEFLQGAASERFKGR